MKKRRARLFARQRLVENCGKADEFFSMSNPSPALAEFFFHSFSCRYERRGAEYYFDSVEVFDVLRLSVMMPLMTSMTPKILRRMLSSI